MKPASPFDAREATTAMSANVGGVVRPVHIFHQSAGAAVVDGERCLVLRQGREWIFPKGHIEQGETPEMAAAREVREETGLDVVIAARVGSTRYEFTSRPGHTPNRKVVEWFLARVTGGHLALERNFREAEFLPFDDVMERLTHEADRDVARRAFEIVRGTAE